MLRLFALVLVLLHLVPRAGYGTRTFVPGLAIICNRLLKYINKHKSKLQAYLPPDAYTCVTGLITCLDLLVRLLNKSAP